MRFRTRKEIKTDINRDKFHPINKSGIVKSLYCFVFAFYRFLYALFSTAISFDDFKVVPFVSVFFDPHLCSDRTHGLLFYIYIFVLELKGKPSNSSSSTEGGPSSSGQGEGVSSAQGEGEVGGGKVSWHSNFCMPGISLCFKV